MHFAWSVKVAAIIWNLTDRGPSNHSTAFPIVQGLGIVLLEPIVLYLAKSPGTLRRFAAHPLQSPFNRLKYLSSLLLVLLLLLLVLLFSLFLYFVCIICLVFAVFERS
jgi:hypothetical protein